MPPKKALPAAEKPQKFKYSNSESVSEGFPELCTVGWPNSDDEEEDSDEDENEWEDEEGDEDEVEDETEIEQHSAENKEKSTQEAAKLSPKVNEKGYPITKAGFEKFIYMNKEQYNRDPENFNMYIYNDWAGYGVTEVLENLLADFNKDLYKKNVSPVAKWAYAEGLVTWLRIGELHNLMMNENSSHIEEIFEYFIPFLITSLEVLAEHNLFSEPNPKIQNPAIICVLLIEFLKHEASDFSVDGIHEIVRAADKLGLALDVKPEYKLSTTNEEIEELREEYKESEEQAVSWKTGYAAFKSEHQGGKHYDISKMSKADKRSYQYRH